MEGLNSMGMGLMAVFAVSGSVVLVASQVQKRLLSQFMQKIEFEICGSGKKRVRFAEDVRVIEPSLNNKEYRIRKRNNLMTTKKKNNNKQFDQFLKMPLNRQILYQGMAQYKTLQSHNLM